MKNKLNVRLLNRIKKHLLEEPKRYFQGWWAVPADEVVYRGEDGPPACGTQGCIAGWAVLLDSKKTSWKRLITQHEEDNYFENKATKLLGLDTQQASALFSANNQVNMTGKKGVREAVQKIDLLIKDSTKFLKKYYQR